MVSQKKSSKELIEEINQNADNMNFDDILFNNLKNKQVLIALDNAEDPISNDNLKFASYIESILDNCPKVKIVLTTRKQIKHLAHNNEKVFRLDVLPKESSIRLFLMRAPRKISNNEITELLQCSIPEESKLGQSLEISMDDVMKKDPSLIDHPFTKLLGGHPQAIALAAPLLKDNSLKDLFLQFCKTNMMDVIDTNSHSKSEYTSLRVSLEMSIKRLKDIECNDLTKNQLPQSKNTMGASKILNLFSLIGMLPGGVTKDELSQLWGGGDWEVYKEELLNSSLLSYKTDAAGATIYSMLPFMSIRANELLDCDPPLKAEYHTRCCRLFKGYCRQFYLAPYAKRSSLALKEALVNIESNIWA